MRRLIGLGIVVLSAAVVLVPTIARARQQVDRKDATRLSIKHSWVGVAPPTKASLAPTQVAVVPAPAAGIDWRPVALFDRPLRRPAPRTLGYELLDPLRGPPSQLS